jgi:hypothetical protein
MADEDVTLATEAQPTADPAPAPAPAPEAEAPKALMDDAGDDTPKAPAEFPDDWREKLAGEDEKALNLLKRLGSPADMAKKLIEQERVIRSGKHKEGLKEGASEDEIKAYREANGIPETPEGYFDKLDGVVIGDDYKEGFTEFFKEAHANNVDPKAAALAAKHFLKIESEKTANIAEQDRQAHAEGRQLLNEKYGADLTANMADLKAWLNSEDGIYEAITAARGPDGKLLGTNPQVVDFLVRQMREINPLSTVVGSGAAGAQGLKDEIAKFEKMMREEPKEYWKQENQDRYRKLLEAEERQASRAA